MVRMFGRYVPIKIIILAITECGLIILSVLLAAWIRFGNLADTSWYLTRPYTMAQIATVVVICWLCLYYNDLYDLQVVARRSELVVHLMQSLGTAALILALLYYVQPDLSLGRGVAVLTAALILATLIVWRLTVETGKFFRPVHRIVIAGTGPGGVRLVREILAHPELNLKVLGFLDERGENIGKPLVNPGIVGGVNEIEAFVRREQVDWVILAFGERRGVMPTRELLRLKLSGVRIEDAHSLFEKLMGGVMLERLSASWLVLSEGFRKDYLLMFTKRFLDVVISALVLVILSPLLLLIALAIVLESGTPVLFRQERVGLHGRNFSILKFRSMKNDAEEGGAVWATRGDARITGVGKILRRYRLDEIPQVVNILRGDMSLVGPRPERPEFVGMLGEQIPFYHERHTVRPGLTGWAQIKYQYGSTVEDAKTKLEYELFYIKHLSLFLDLLIVFQTVQVVFSGKGAR
jgi:sugar transferase (PEP-CTERM system associated)